MRMPRPNIPKCAGVAAIPLLIGGATIAGAAEPPAQLSEASEPQAQTQTPPIATESAAGQSAQQEPSKKKWQFATIGYVWFATAKGETDVIKPVEPVGLDLSFGDVLKGLKFAFMGAAEARRDRLVILGDLTYVHLGTSKGIDIRNQDFLDASLHSKTAEITLVGGYRVIDKKPVMVDLLAGGRMNFFKTSLELEGPNRSAQGSVTQNWLDPLIAARAVAPLGGKWNFSLYGDLGGIVFGSDVTWQAVATVDYQINRKMRLGVGWRHFKVNYDNGDFLYNVRQTGPLIVFRTAL